MRGEVSVLGPHRRALSLLEVLVAGILLLVALIPTVGLMSTSSREVTKSRDRLVAIHLATALSEEMRVPGKLIVTAPPDPSPG
jgi:Tfp pilus assembly protein PilV